MAITKVSPNLLDLDAGITISVADNSDNLTLTSTDADANSGPNLRLYRNSSSPADGDNIGQLDWEGRNDNSQDVVYASMLARVRDNTDGTEDGGIQLDIMKDGSLTGLWKYYSNGTTSEFSINDDSIDMDFRVESNGNANMLFVDGGNNRVTINHNNVTQVLGRGQNGTATIAIEKEDNFEDGNLDHVSFGGETYTVTLLDSSVAILAPEAELIPEIGYQINAENGMDGALGSRDMMWIPFVDNVQHISQTISGCSVSGNSGQLFIGNPVNPNFYTPLTLYPKRMTATTHTSIIVTGEMSGCVKEFPITMTLI